MNDRGHSLMRTHFWMEKGRVQLVNGFTSHLKNTINSLCGQMQRLMWTNAKTDGISNSKISSW